MCTYEDGSDGLIRREESEAEMGFEAYSLLQ